MKQTAIDKLNFCLKLWKTQGHCTFGKKTFCHQCATPYLLYKLITGKIIHNKRLSLEDWKKCLNQIKDKNIKETSSF